MNYFISYGKLGNMNSKIKEIANLFKEINLNRITEGKIVPICLSNKNFAKRGYWWGYSNI